MAQVMELNTSGIKDKGQTISYGKKSLRFVINTIVRIVNDNYRAIEDFALQFDTGDLYTTAEKIWNYIHNQLRYVKDEYGKEQIRTPQRTLVDGQGDCEDFAILAASILKALGYDPYFYIVSFDGLGWQHIFVGVDDIIIDPVHTAFNEFPPGIVKSFTVGLDGNIPSYIDAELQGIYVDVLEGVDPVQDFGHLIEGWDEDMNPVFDQEVLPKVEQYIDMLQGGATLGEIGSIRSWLRRQAKKLGKGIKKASKKVGHFMKQKGFAPARAAYLLFLKLNLFNQAAKLYIGYLSPEKARQMGIDTATYNKLRDAVRRLERFWVKAGGRIDALRKAIQHGRAAKKIKKTFGLSGLGSVASKAKIFWQYVENMLKKKGVKLTHIKRAIRRNSDQKLAKARSAFLRLLRKNHRGVASILYLAYLPAEKVKPYIGNDYDKLKSLVSALERYWQQKGGKVQDLRNAIVAGGKNKLGLGAVATATAATTAVAASAPFWKKVLDWLKGIKWKDLANKAISMVSKSSAPEASYSDRPGKSDPGLPAPSGQDVPAMPAGSGSSMAAYMPIALGVIALLLLSGGKNNNSNNSK